MQKDDQNKNHNHLVNESSSILLFGYIINEYRIASFSLYGLVSNPWDLSWWAIHGIPDLFPKRGTFRIHNFSHGEQSTQISFE